MLNRPLYQYRLLNWIIGKGGEGSEVPRTLDMMAMQGFSG